MLLSSHPQDPEYSRLLAQLPSYQSSLETRYPPICQSCLPAVEEEIQRRDHMARTSALGGFLKESRGKEKQRQVAITREKRDLVERRLFVWRIRGLLWIEGVFAAIAGYSSGKYHTIWRPPPVTLRLTHMCMLHSRSGLLATIVTYPPCGCVTRLSPPVLSVDSVGPNIRVNI